VLTVSLLLPPKSGRVPIASFCVEQGRWTARGKEDHAKFSSSGEAMPSVRALLSMAAPPPPSAPQAGAADPASPSVNTTARIGRQTDEVANKQREVWDQVAATQKKLSRGVGAAVASPQSTSSLQLSLENEKLKEARGTYVKALQASGEKEADVIGYVVAINGKMSAASIYPSNALFRKMWGKQLAAVVTEAIGEKQPSAPAAAPPPAPAAATEFLAEAEKGKKFERALAAGMRQEVRDADKALLNEARGADGKWIHRSYLAK
jgi:hypothetical protein